MHAQTHHYRYQQTKRATLLGGLKNIFLGTLKVIFGITGHSHALLADGLHSFSDLLTDILVLFAARFGSEKADANHPYGHQRIETAASMFLAFLLLLAGLTIAYQAITHLFENISHEKPDFYVLIVAAASTLLNEVLFQYTHRTAKKIKSDLLLANAWHHRSDAASSLVVLLGIVGALMGFYRADLVAAAIVGAMIIKMGGELAWTSISELVDTGVPADVLKTIEKTISSTKGVQAIHQLRTRSMGGAIFVDVHVLVDSKLSVSEGHYIAEKVHQYLINAIERVEDVTVHIDSEDDTTVFQSLVLPGREELLLELEQKMPQFHWETYSDSIVLHYLQGKIFIEIHDDRIKINAENVQYLLSEIPILGGIILYNHKREKK
jgi:cation diffusion facilitator family transporter